MMMLPSRRRAFGRPVDAGLAVLNCLALAVFCGCGPKLPENVIALVNGIPVTIQEVDERFGRLQKDLEDQAAGIDNEVDGIKRAIVMELINRKLFLSEAKARNLSVPIEVVEGEKAKFAAGMAPEDTAEILADAGITAQRLEETIREDLLIRKLSDSLTSGLTVPDGDIADYYTKNRDQFLQQESVRARQIVVSTENDMRNLRRRLAAGEDFAKVAQEVSQSPDAKNGGDLGFFQRGQMPPELEEWAFSLKPGQLSPVIETPYGFHILKVEEHRPAELLSLAEAKGTITAELLSKKREEKFQALLSDLWRGAKIIYNTRKHADLIPREEA